MSSPAKYLVFLLLFAPVSLYAQEGPTDKGSVNLGGSISFSNWGGDLYEEPAGKRYYDFLVNPRALFFVTHGLAVGGEIYVEKESQGEWDATTISIGPTLAYFFGDSNSSTFPFLSASVGYSKVSTSGSDGSGLAFAGSAGLVFMLSRSVGLSASSTYHLMSISFDQYDDAYSGDVFSLALGVEVFLH